MKKGFFVAFVMIALASNICAIDTKTVQNGVSYLLYESPLRAVVYEVPNKEEVSIPSEINHKGIILPVVRVYYGAFKGCRDMTSLTLPEAITEIGDYAFEECESLESLDIPNGVVKIGRGAFDRCDNLRTISLGKSIKDFDISSLRNRSSLVSVKVDDDNQFFSSEKGVLFNKDKSKLLIYPKAKSARTYDIPVGVREITNNAFSYCHNLIEVVIPEGVETIGEFAFCDCYKITSITIPSSVTSLRYNAFRDCSGLKTVVWNAKKCQSPKGYVDGAPFPEPTSFIFGDEVESIPSQLCYRMKLSSIVLPNGLKEIGDDAFAECKLLVSIKLPANLETIGNRAFSMCKKITYVKIPNSVKIIGSNAFSWCDNLKSVQIGTGVKRIGKGAFDDCILLKSIICLATTPPDMLPHESVYDNVSSVQVPSGCVDGYKDAEGWNGFKKISVIVNQ